MGKFPHTIALKRIKYIGTSLTKKMKNLYIKNCKALMNKIEDYTKK